jgi:hypothetical protein
MPTAAELIQDTQLRKQILDALDEGREIPDDAREAARLFYQMSLWYMSTELCDVPLHEIHREICDFFVHKDPRKPIEYQNEEGHATVRERLLLFPRHGWKTTINALDSVNWIIAFPLVPIAIQTGDGDLAAGIVGLIKSYFVVPGWDGKRDDNLNPIWNPQARPTKFQRLFPEHCVKETQQGAEDFFVTPARLNRKFNPTSRYIKDPTVYALSIESNNSGWRCQVEKNDDILTDNNIRTPTRVTTIDNRFHMSHKLLPWWGYRDTVGTRYENDDTYGLLMQKLLDLKGEICYGNIEVPGKFKYLCLPSWWIKGTSRNAEGDLKGKYLPPTLESKEEDCEFLDKDIWPFDAMHQDMALNAKSHSSQYLNNPVLAGEAKFTREGLLNFFIDWTQMPQYAKTFAIVDLAYSDKRGRDYTVIAIGAWYNNALWVKDIIRGRFRPEEMPEQIVGAVRDYPEIEAMGIEESVGARWLQTDIFQSAERQGIKMPPIEWITLGQGELNAKENRIDGLVPLHKDGRLFFLNNMRTETEEIIKEFVSSRGKKDIPDAISRLLKYQSSGESPEQKQAQIELRQKMREQDQYDMIFGQGRYAYREPEPEPEPEEVEPEPQVDEVTGLPLGDFYGSQRY